LNSKFSIIQAENELQSSGLRLQSISIPFVKKGLKPLSSAAQRAKAGEKHPQQLSSFGKWHTLEICLCALLRNLQHDGGNKLPKLLLAFG
jgi:hypothetical protein